MLLQSDESKERAREPVSLALCIGRNRRATAPRALRFGPVFSPKALDPARRIHKLLLASEKRMAIRADFHVDRRHGRPGLDDVPAGADDLGRVILGMYTLFHLVLLPTASASIASTPLASQGDHTGMET